MPSQGQGPVLCLWQTRPQGEAPHRTELSLGLWPTGSLFFVVATTDNNYSLDTHTKWHFPTLININARSLSTEKIDELQAIVDDDEDEFDEDEFIWLHMQNTIAAIIQR